MCQEGSEVNTCDPSAGAASDDSLCNGLDDDCDGQFDEDFTETGTVDLTSIDWIDWGTNEATADYYIMLKNYRFIQAQKSYFTP